MRPAVSLPPHSRFGNRAGSLGLDKNIVASQRGLVPGRLIRFSFGTFCHICWERQQEYYRNIFPKMRVGATAMVMIADFDKFNAALSASRSLRICFQRFYKNVVLSDLLEIAQRFRDKLSGRQGWQGHANFRPWTENDKTDPIARPGRWYHAGVERTCRFLESVGWEVVNPDVGLCPRDPIVHFRKPS